MRKIATMWACVFLSPLAYANDVPSRVLLDTVMFQVTAKQWVTTQTALLTVNIHVTLTQADLVKARSDILSLLAKIAPGEWHLTQFDRSQDSSGLEKLFVQAQARILQSGLTNVYQQAKAVSKPGASYEIGGIEFKPSLDEVQQARGRLREQLYQQAHDEMARINKIYTGQNYSLSRLVFSEGDALPMPQLKTFATAMPMNAGMSVPLSVSNELTMTATVQAASNRTEGAH